MKYTKKKNRVALDDISSSAVKIGVSNNPGYVTEEKRKITANIESSRFQHQTFEHNNLRQAHSLENIANTCNTTPRWVPQSHINH